MHDPRVESAGRLHQMFCDPGPFYDWTGSIQYSPDPPRPLLLTLLTNTIISFWTLNNYVYSLLILTFSYCTPAKHQYDWRIAVYEDRYIDIMIDYSCLSRCIKRWVVSAYCWDKPINAYHHRGLIIVATLVSK